MHPADRPYEKLIAAATPPRSPATGASPTPCTPTACRCSRSSTTTAASPRACTRGSRYGRRRRCRTRCSARSRRRSRSRRSASSSPGTRSRPGTARRAGSTGWRCSARRRRCCGSSSPRSPTGAPTATAATSAAASGSSVRSSPPCGRRSGRAGRSACGSAATRGSPAAPRSPEAVATARILDGDGHVDYVNTSVGVATATLHLVEPPMGVPPGYALPVAAAIRAAVAVPVIGVGRFTDPATGRTRARRRPLRPGRRRPRADRRPGVRAARARRGPYVCGVQPGVCRAGGPQPAARVPGEPARRTGVGAAPAAPRPAGTCSWWAAARPG